MSASTKTTEQARFNAIQTDRSRYEHQVVSAILNRARMMADSHDCMPSAACCLMRQISRQHRASRTYISNEPSTCQLAWHCEPTLRGNNSPAGKTGSYQDSTTVLPGPLPPCIHNGYDPPTTKQPYQAVRRSRNEGISTSEKRDSVSTLFFIPRIPGYCILKHTSMLGRLCEMEAYRDHHHRDTHVQGDTTETAPNHETGEAKGKQSHEARE